MTPRRDAVANKEKLLAAAAAAIKARGEKVPMAEIAELAGVGVGTLYRHFPTRERLLSGLTERSLRAVLSRARSAAADARTGSAIGAIGGFFEQTIAHRDELILPLHGGPVITDPANAELRAEIRRALEQVLAHGRADGTIRAGITATDIIITGAQLAQPLPNAEHWDELARRQAQIYLAGLAAG